VVVHWGSCRGLDALLPQPGSRTPWSRLDAVVLEPTHRSDQAREILVVCVIHARAPGREMPS